MRKRRIWIGFCRQTKCHVRPVCAVRCLPRLAFQCLLLRKQTPRFDFPGAEKCPEETLIGSDLSAFLIPYRFVGVASEISLTQSTQQIAARTSRGRWSHAWWLKFDRIDRWGAILRVGGKRQISDAPGLDRRRESLSFLGGIRKKGC